MLEEDLIAFPGAKKRGRISPEEQRKWNGGGGGEPYYPCAYLTHLSLRKSGRGSPNALHQKEEKKRGWAIGSFNPGRKKTKSRMSKILTRALIGEKRREKELLLSSNNQREGKTSSRGGKERGEKNSVLYARQVSAEEGEKKKKGGESSLLGEEGKKGEKKS